MPQITVSDELLKWLKSDNQAHIEYFGPAPFDPEDRKNEYQRLIEFHAALSEAK